LNERSESNGCRSTKSKSEPMFSGLTPVGKDADIAARQGGNKAGGGHGSKAGGSGAEVRFGLVLRPLNANTKLDHQLCSGKEDKCWTGPL
jgi:hypothetical protein